MERSQSPPRIDPATVAEVLERIHRVPDGYRRFSVTDADRREIHKIDDELAEHLLDLGLPHRGGGPGARLYDFHDLENVGLGLELPCTFRIVMGWLAQSFVANGAEHERRFQVATMLTCPEPGHPGDCDFALHDRIAELSAPESFRRVRHDGFAFDVVRQPVRHYFGEPFDELIARAEPLRFHMIPQRLMKDVGFIEATGLGECTVSTLYFTRIAEELGLPVRPATGVVLATPRSVPHYWLEFRVGDRWLSADPFLIKTFAEMHLIDPVEWPPNRSPEGALWGLANERIELATHRGGPVRPAFHVRESRRRPS